MLYLCPRRGHSLYLSSCSWSVVGSSWLLLNRLRFVYARGGLCVFFPDDCLRYLTFLNHQLLHVDSSELAGKINEQHLDPVSGQRRHLNSSYRVHLRLYFVDILLPDLTLRREIRFVSDYYALALRRQ